ncbi:MAG TPA: PTS sugar transporter subunit IIA [Planctomycetota bacterium]|nr:PTS sugar transporter subunit IIA [Planctomycetota bacterium]
MKLGDIIPDGGIMDDLKSVEKEDVIKEMVQALVKTGRIEEASSAKVIKALMDREELGSTGIGAGVAVPHAKHDSITDLVGAFGRSKKGINFDALDGEPVHILFLLLSSKNASGAHLEALAYISRLVRDEKFVKFLKDAKDVKELRDLLSEADQQLGGS